MIAAPLFHSWGFFHFVISLPTAVDDGAAAPLRPGGDSARRAGKPRRGAGGGAGDDPADPPPSRGDPCLLRPLLAADHLALGLGAAGRAGDRVDGSLRRHRSTTSTARPRSPTRPSPTPADLRAAPGTAGRPPRGTVVRLYRRAAGARCPQGEVGRIFVGNEMSFEGYTGGGGKEVVDGLLCSGDVGHFDSDGRLFIDGRDDEMIVSGGENVFPREVEDLLADHEGGGRGGGDRGRGRGVRPAPEGLCRLPRTMASSPRRT